MCYDMNLLTNSPLCEPWRAAYCQEMKKSGNFNVSNICEILDHMLTNDGHSTLRRLSLRESSVLINGTARLFKTEVDRLREDVFTFSQQMAISSYQSVSSADSNDHLEISVDDYEMESSTELTDIHTDGILNEKELADEDWDEFECSCMNICPDQFANVENGICIDGNEINSLTVLKTCTMQNMPNTESLRKIKNDKAVQTSDNFCGEDSNRFDRELPFGLVLIHENYESRRPSKILLSSLNNSVKYI